MIELNVGWTRKNWIQNEMVRLIGMKMVEKSKQIRNVIGAKALEISFSYEYRKVTFGRKLKQQGGISTMMEWNFADSAAAVNKLWRWWKSASRAWKHRWRNAMHCKICSYSGQKLRHRHDSKLCRTVDAAVRIRNEMVALRRMKTAENSEQFCKYAKILITKNQFFEAIWFVQIAQVIFNENKNNKSKSVWSMSTLCLWH